MPEDVSQKFSFTYSSGDTDTEQVNEVTRGTQKLNFSKCEQRGQSPIFQYSSGDAKTPNTVSSFARSCEHAENRRWEEGTTWPSECDGASSTRHRRCRRSGASHRGPPPPPHSPPSACPSSPLSSSPRPPLSSSAPGTSRRNRRVRPSMAADASANDGTPRRGVFPEERRRLRPLLCGAIGTARPHPRVRCVLAPWSVVRHELLHPMVKLHSTRRVTDHLHVETV